MSVARFSVGEVVRHKLFGYYGVIYDVDAYFMGSDEWYEAVAKTRPSKDKPWYRVLVDDQQIETYVAQQNLTTCPHRSIDHPLVAMYFKKAANGNYILRRLST